MTIPTCVNFRSKRFNFSLKRQNNSETAKNESVLFRCIPCVWKNAGMATIKEVKPAGGEKPRVGKEKNFGSTGW